MLFTKSIRNASAISETAISAYLKKRKTEDNKAFETASVIFKEIESKGFIAIAKFTKKFDKIEITKSNIKVPQSALKCAENALSADERAAILEMITRVRKFSIAQKKSMGKVSVKSTEGITELVFKPVETVGIYVPSGLAPLFSSLVMAAVPAQAAGVKNIIVCTPPKATRAQVRLIYATANLCGIKQVYRIGGAQAIFAMALGLEGLMPKAEVICGPGNSYVSAAKQIALSMAGVRIDVPAGPSEVLVIADESANTAYVAADMLAQAEHGAGSAAICICIGEETAANVIAEVSMQLEKLPESSPARISIPKWGRVWIAKDIDEAIGASEKIAPEHLELAIKNASKCAGMISNAGAVFILTAEAFCDYGMSGGNHILPTGTAAKTWGGVNVQTFGKWQYVEMLNGKAQSKLAKTCAQLARMEGLEAHARAAEIRERVKRN